jgi:hypothetical protein
MIANKCETGHKKLLKSINIETCGKKQVPSGSTPGELGLEQRVRMGRRDVGFNGYACAKGEPAFLKGLGEKTFKEFT